MAKHIPQERIDSGELDESEIIYLQDRGRLPSHVQGYIRDSFSGQLQSKDPYDLIRHCSLKQIKEFYHRRKQELENDTPVIGDKGGVVEDDDEADEYEGMKTDELRDLLKERELTHTGNKAELLDRLRRYDADELTKEDHAK